MLLLDFLAYVPTRGHFEIRVCTCFSRTLQGPGVFGVKALGLCWLLVSGFNSGCHSKETIFFTIDPYLY